MSNSKTRIALGLAPLADPNAATDEAEPTEDEVAADNYAREKSARDNARREADARDRLEKARNQRELQAKLSGKGLGEAAASNEEDVKSWLKKSKKKAKSMAADLAKRRAAEQAELDAELQAKYDEEDLAGMKVGHSMEDFDGESEAVLTLKDSRITGEENEDELENVSMAERARNEDRLRLAREGKRGKQYNPYGDDEEFTAPGKKRGVLSKYDVDIPGADQSESSEGFTLGQGASSRDAAGHAKVFEAVDKPVQKTAEARKQVAQQLGQTLNADLNYESVFVDSTY